MYGQCGGVGTAVGEAEAGRGGETAQGGAAAIHQQNGHAYSGP